MAADEIYDLFDTLLSVADTLHCPRAGTKYLYAWTNEDSKKDWRADGYRWRQNGNSIVKSQDGAMKKTFFYVREKSYAKLQRINRLIYLGLRQRRSSLNPFTFELAHITELCIVEPFALDLNNVVVVGQPLYIHTNVRTTNISL